MSGLVAAALGLYIAAMILTAIGVRLSRAELCRYLGGLLAMCAALAGLLGGMDLRALMVGALGLLLVSSWPERGSEREL